MRGREEGKDRRRIERKREKRERQAKGREGERKKDIGRHIEREEEK